MFTGIITNLGEVKKISATTFVIAANASFCKKLAIGTSIAVNGVCLTVEKNDQKSFSVTIMPETLKKTMLSALKISGLVNLELPVTPATFLSGHIVQGHVDGIGKIIDIKEEGNSKMLTINIQNQKGAKETKGTNVLLVDGSLAKYIVKKGSIAVNGISLTVITATQTYFTVGIIPYTWQHTMLHTIKKGDLVNIETDILGKYVEKLLRTGLQIQSGN